MRKVIKDKELGEITLIKSLRNKYIRITLTSVRRIKITMPFFSSFSKALDFLDQNRSKIEHMRENLKRTKRNKVNFTFGENNSVDLITFTTVRFIATTCEKTYVKCSCVYYPKKFGNTVEIGQYGWDELYNAYLYILRREARRYLLSRVKDLRDELSTKGYEFNFNKVIVKNNRTNWGSCSTLNNINLNMHLLELTPELCDFVILHEMCHLKHHNHGAEFYDLLDTLCGGKEQLLRKELHDKHMLRI